MIDPAYSTCLRIARQHYENFPVASVLLPKQVRHHVAAVYAFARIADDYADEGERSDVERLQLLEQWRARLRLAAEGRFDEAPSETRDVFVALAATIRTFHLEPQLFDDLIDAFAQDVSVKRYATWEQLIDYCRRSANPVGRLLLRIHGYRDPELDRLSDAVCTALQLTNFWQDLARDLEKGRIYVPGDVLTLAQAREGDLLSGEWPLAWQLALGEAGRRTRALFEDGRAVASSVRGRLRWELRATWLGGVRILDRLEQAHYDVRRTRPSLTWRDGVLLGWDVLTWR
ncbi:MAG: squalene synthase HpnC [Vicinamibacterales bacterium]